MFIIVGLGNPGSKYAHTHHNVGFDVVEILSQKHNIPLNRSKCKAQVGEGMIAGKKVVLCQPQTFMNLSGESVVALTNWYKPEPGELIVVYDDVDLPFGRLRVRAKGSAGTHNGMRSIIYLLGRDDFSRVRVGIGRPPENWDLADYVLSGYTTPAERKIAFDSYTKAAEAIEMILEDNGSVTRATSSTANFNAVPTPPKPEEPAKPHRPSSSEPAPDKSPTPDSSPDSAKTLDSTKTAD